MIRERRARQTDRQTDGQGVLLLNSKHRHKLRKKQNQKKENKRKFINNMINILGFGYRTSLVNSPSIFSYVKRGINKQHLNCNE